jgi:hypothetical protein
VLVERGLNDAPLHAAPAAVHQPHLGQAGGRRGLDVVIHNRRDIARQKRVEIELALNRNPNRAVVHDQDAA